MKNRPFITLRCYGTGRENDRFLNVLFEACRRHPGLVSEIWFCCGSLDGLEVVRKQCEECLPYRETCRELGIAFSVQQGITLNHAPDGKERLHFSCDAWAVGSDGEVKTGMLCPTSPEAREYNRAEAALVMKLLKPDFYWPDDDLRLFHKLPGGVELCFCPRCLERFNRQNGFSFTRESLWEMLNRNRDDEAARVRRLWVDSNAANLAEFATVYREAAAAEAPNCRLGIQSVFADWCYDGADFRALLTALSGPEKRPVGIRPGALYYYDRDVMLLLTKMLNVVKESARTHQLPLPCHVTYEAENWPHVAAPKNPHSMLHEAALALGCGADSLALYWGSDFNAEDPETWMNFFEILHHHRPFLERLQATVKGTLPGGAALYRGAGRMATADWSSFNGDTAQRLWENSLPVTRQEAAPEVNVLDARAAAELTAEELPVCLRLPVLVDAAALQILQQRFPDFAPFHAVTVQSAAELAPATAGWSYLEVMREGESAGCVKAVYTPKDASVRKLSMLTHAPDSCGSCVIPVPGEPGIVAVQFLADAQLWTGPRRRMILDALDSLTPGGLSARLLTNGYSVALVSHLNAAGRTTGVTLFNLGMGRTLPLTVALRRPEAGRFILYRPEEEALTLGEVFQDQAEIIFTLPPAGAREIVHVSITE